MAPNKKTKVPSRPPSGPYAPPTIIGDPATCVVQREVTPRPDKGKPSTIPSPTFHARCRLYDSHNERVFQYANDSIIPATTVLNTPSHEEFGLRACSPPKNTDMMIMAGHGPTPRIRICNG